MGGELESSISALCGSLAKVLDHAESSSCALADAVSQRPIHLGMTFFRAVAEPEVDAEEDEGAAPGISCFDGSSSVLKSATNFSGSPMKLYKNPEKNDTC